tara:strand:+ start:60752 stop:60853 length:102 start_codon:yes stop_codon:yes gene_type:complete
MARDILKLLLGLFVLLQDLYDPLYKGRLVYRKM